MNRITLTPAPELVQPWSRLSIALDAVRSGNYQENLTTLVNELFIDRQRFRQYGDELGFARIHSIRWEIYDQKGEYDEALSGIEEIAEHEYLPYIRSAKNVGSFKDPTELVVDYKLRRQKVMCCLAYGFALYRLRRYDDAKDILNACKTFLEKALMVTEGTRQVLCWGTWARYHYFYGQILRSEQQFSLATDEFMAALDCVRRRLDADKAQGKPSEKLHIEQLFANHCTAKVLAFGLGWIARLRGDLSKAWEQLQAARLILWDSHDEFLKGQVDWLSCSILRAKEGISLELENILPAISECCRKLEKHTEYYLQARREHAVVLLNLALAHRQLNPDKCADLLSRALNIVNEYLPRCRNNTKVLALVLQSRIILALNGEMWSRDCEDAAREAYSASRTLEHKGIQAEAAIAFGEALSAMPTKRRNASDKTADPRKWREAEQHFNEVIGDRRDNILARCATYLCLAELKLKQYNVVEATSYLRLWEKNSANVSHKWLHQKAASVKSKLDAHRFFLVDYEDRRKWDELSFTLIKFLVDRERAKQPFTISSAAANIGIDERTFKEWEEKIRLQEAYRIQLHTPK